MKTWRVTVTVYPQYPRDPVRARAEATQSHESVWKVAASHPGAAAARAWARAKTKLPPRVRIAHAVFDVRREP